MPSCRKTTPACKKTTPACKKTTFACKKTTPVAVSGVGPERHGRLCLLLADPEGLRVEVEVVGGARRDLGVEAHRRTVHAVVHPLGVEAMIRQTLNG
jgi:hypothetical protein